MKTTIIRIIVIACISFTSFAFSADSDTARRVEGYSNIIEGSGFLETPVPHTLTNFRSYVEKQKRESHSGGSTKRKTRKTRKNPVSPNKPSNTLEKSSSLAQSSPPRSPKGKEKEIAQSHFYIESHKLRTRVDAILHPVLHGCAEKQEGFFDSLKKTASKTSDALSKGNYSKAWEETRNNSSIWSTLKTVAGSVISKYAGKEAERVLFHGGFYNDDSESSSSSESSGSMSLEALNAAEEEIKNRFPDWNEKSKCPEGILKCHKLGHNSKTILTFMYAFFDNIKKYEERTGKDFFSHADTNRTFAFLSNTATRICEENILFAITSKNSSAPNDIQLKPYSKVMNYLVAIPTEMHDPTEYMRKNSKEIAEKTEFLPLKPQRRKIYTYMGTLADRAREKDYGHKKGDSSTNLLFSGPTGTGKTFLGKQLPELLGFPPMVITLEELQRGQESSSNELEDLVDDPEISGLETKILVLDRIKKKSRMPLNPIGFIDELDTDRKSSISELKDRFDQFKKIYLPSLGLTIPGFLNCIFTSNNESLFTDPALISRFLEIRFLKMPQDKKAKILLKAINERVSSRPELQKDYEDGRFEELTQKAVDFDKRINIRIFLDNVHSIISFVDTQNKLASGHDYDYLVPVEDRSSEPEPYEEFLQRTFGGLNLGDFSDSDSESDEECIDTPPSPIKTSLKLRKLCFKSQVSIIEN